MLSKLNIKISLKFTLGYYMLFLGFAISINNSIFAQNQPFKIVLDAGHGGKDPGTLGKANYKNSYESDIALKVVLQIGRFFINDDDIKTIYTRKKDDFIPLHKRGTIANKADADLFVSIHCNAAVTNAYGTTTYVLGVGKSAKNLELSKRENDVILLEDDYEKNYDYDPNSEEFLIGLRLMQEDYQDKSIEFAQIVQNKFVSVAKRKNRGVNQGNLAVLYDSYMPSVLIEIGFLTNKTEEKFLHTKAGQYIIAKAIYEAIKTYKKRIDNNSIYDSTDKITNDVTEEIKTTKEDFTNNYYYKIQIATNRKKISLTPNNFKKLKDVERIKYGNIYKYFYGKTTDLEDAKKIRKKVSKLYSDAFVKRFINYETIKKNTKQKEENNITNNNVDEKSNSDFYYCVQIASNSKKIELKSYNFNGLKDVFRKKYGNIYKYFYGSLSSIEEARIIQQKVIKLGYTDAFVKKFKNTNKKTTIKNNTKSTIYNGITFKVQVSSGKRKIETKTYNFRGLKNIERVKIGSFYKYYYGKTNDYNLIKKMQKDARKKGYNDATVVAIKNNKLININSILK